MCYGVCETMNGNWSQLDTTTRLGASATQASLALAAMLAAVAGGVIAFYQLGYGIAAFGVGLLDDSGISLSKIFGFTAFVAAGMGLLSFIVARRRAEQPGVTTGSPPLFRRASTPGALSSDP